MISSQGLQFSPYPGAHERHLKRRAGNPLFPPKQRQVIQMEISQAQRRDAEEVEAFLQHFQDLVQRATTLQPQEDSDVILKLKEQLDQLYERSCSLAGDTGPIQDALQKLLRLVMQAVWRGAETDPAAQQNLREEEIARATHFQLLKDPLIADLLRPDSPIEAQDLVPTLLSAPEPSLEAALTLFDATQSSLMVEQAEALVASLPDDLGERRTASMRLEQMRRWLTQLLAQSQTGKPA